MSLSLSHRDILKITGGKALSSAKGEGVVTSVAIDSRSCIAGALFVPLKGESTDGHRYLDKAFTAGAAASFVEEHYYENHREEVDALIRDTNGLFVLVPECLKAMQDLARYHLASLKSVTKIGVTGSSGKTTTKEIIGALLNQAAPAYINEGNLNSEIGLPLAVFGLTGEHRFAVFEMGMNRVGEMELLADILKPDISIITNIGTAHIGKLGSRESIAAEKKKVFSNFTGTETAFIFEDEPWFEYLCHDLKGRVVKYGPRSTEGIRMVRDRGLEGYRLQVGGAEINFPLMGHHNFLNACCAVSVARFLGVGLKEIAAGLSKVQPLFGRGEVIPGRVTIVQDCYNANLDSTVRAIDLVDDLSWNGRKVLVLGSMLELGDASKEEHEAIGRRASESEAKGIFFFGEEAGWSSAACRDKGRNCFWTEDYEELQRQVVSFLRPDDIILLKGSRMMALERLTEVINEDFL
ncbi:MAG: UDP-N-acetylmuramoyl-tripeptide--D-alanyl-D-alanine ligase [Spirochaetales bacterium]|nr:UDP-N-acetylmuramoyl-tripeptide--D-alanyl-D-alanine ligase [Spirochaetales bacterium]